MKKISYIVAILTVLIVASLNFVSAYDPFKWQICGALNLTGGDCDDWWEEFQGTQKPDYYNKSEIDKLLSNWTKGSYYNKSEVDKLFANYNWNATANQSSNFSGYVTFADLENNTQTLREFMHTKYAEKEKVEGYDRQSKSSDDNTIWYVAIGILIVIIIFGALKQKVSSEKTYVPPESGAPKLQKILETGEMPDEEPIKKKQRKKR